MSRSIVESKEFKELLKLKVHPLLHWQTEGCSIRRGKRGTKREHFYGPTPQAAMRKAIASIKGEPKP